VRNKNLNRKWPIVLAGFALAAGACTTSHDSSSPTTRSSGAIAAKVSTTTAGATTDGSKSVVLTLDDSGHHVSLTQGELVSVNLPFKASSADRWELLTSGPGLTNLTGIAGLSSASTQTFKFRWARSTPFGMVMILQSAKHKVLEPEEFAVTLDPAKAT
jgi:hypothetical protein